MPGSLSSAFGSPRLRRSRGSTSPADPPKKRTFWRRKSKTVSHIARPSWSSPADQDHWDTPSFRQRPAAAPSPSHNAPSYLSVSAPTLRYGWSPSQLAETTAEDEDLDQESSEEAYSKLPRKLTIFEFLLNEKPSQTSSQESLEMADRLSALNPRMAGQRMKQAHEAKLMQKAVEDHANRQGIDPPPFDFIELIGKGQFGRVFKSKKRDTNEILAVKVMEIDKADYVDLPEFRDDNIRSFHKETSILRQLRDSGAQNVNKFYEAFGFHSQLWIVSEYCPGGSVHTLMRATPGGRGLEENFIKIIAREMAVGLKWVHAAGILHRDLKCANVLITERGQVQLCDFGIAGVLESPIDRRRTIIGTPHWMPPELLHRETEEQGYGPEVDMYEYGTTVFEMATGYPPNTTYNGDELQNIKLPEPRLQGPGHSDELRDFVAFLLQKKPENRPSAEKVLECPYIKGSEVDYPTSGLVAMIERYYIWEARGGNRSSLWLSGGAAGPDAAAEPTDDAEEWNFSTTIDFDEHVEARSGLADTPTIQKTGPEEPKISAQRQRRRKAEQESRIRRGGDRLNKLFNPEEPEPEQEPEINLDGEPDPANPDRSSGSDLALRRYDDEGAGTRKTMIDLDWAVDVKLEPPNIMEVGDLRAGRFSKFIEDYNDEEDDYTYQPNRQSKRATRDWKFPTEPEEVNKNRRTMNWTFDTATAVDTISEDQEYWDSGTAHRRATKELEQPLMTGPPANRATMDFAFPMMDPGPSAISDNGLEFGFDQSPPLGAAFRPQLKHAATTGRIDEEISLDEPDRSSLIDLDFARASMIKLSLAEMNKQRPATASSTADSYVTTGNETDITTGNAFDLDEQVYLSHTNSIGSRHRQSRSEPLSLLPDQEGKSQGYTSDHGPAQSIKERHSREFSAVSTKSSITTDSDTSLANRLSAGRTWRGRTEKQHWSKLSTGLSDPSLGTPNGRRGTFNSAPTSEPESPLSGPYRTRNRYIDTPPSANGSFSSSNFASPETALANGDETTIASTPRSTTASLYSNNSGTYVSPRGPQRVPAYPSLRNGGRGSLLRTTVQAPLVTNARRPVPPHSAALEFTAEPHGLAQESKREGRDQILYLQHLQKTLKTCGASAQARRFGRRSSRGQLHAHLENGGHGGVGMGMGIGALNGYVSQSEGSEGEGFGASTSTNRTVRRISNAPGPGSVGTTARRVITS